MATDPEAPREESPREPERSSDHGLLDKAIAEAEEAAGHSGMGSLFDLRLIIAALFGFYGLLLLGWGLFATDDADVEKAAGIHINLWAGAGMAVFAAAFFAWARWRPLRVPPRSETPPED